MRLDRLNRLITLMEGVQAANLAFDLTRWLTPGSEMSSTTSGTKEACGTAACAFGYAALDPGFQAEGLGFEATWREPGGIVQRRSLTSVQEFNAIIKEPGAVKGWLNFTPVFAEEGHVEGARLAEGFAAALKFFGITHHAAEYLFDPECYRDYETQPILPEQVIERIHEVIDLEGEAPDNFDDAYAVRDDDDGETN